VKIGLTSATVVSAAGSVLDVLPRPLQVAFASWVGLCGCVLLTIVVLREIRKFRKGE
jgi:hypothetical protein